jgi:nitrate reductase NapE component
MATLVARPARTRTDSIYFTTIAFLLMGIVVVGFAPTYFLAGIIRAPLPSTLIHVHGAVFSSWIILFVIQNVLVSTHNVRLHQKLGWLGAAIATAMVILGIMATSDSLRRGATPSIFTPPQFVALNDVGILIFAGMIGLAIWQRRNPALHKRLMLIATISIMPPAIVRFALRTNKPFLGPTVLLALLLSVVAFDIFKRRRPYAVTIIAGVIAFAIFPMSAVLGHTALFQRIAQWIVK